MSDPQAVLIRLLRQQMDGDTEAHQQIARLAQEARDDAEIDGADRRDQSRFAGLTDNQVRCIWMVLQEWEGMFAFVPGRLDAISPLVVLLERTRDPQVDEMDLYGSDEWTELVARRGPVEGVAIRQCDACRTEYAEMGTSGFLDLDSFVCATCGDVAFRSSFDDTPLPACRCGGRLTRGCPSCGSRSGIIVHEMNPYEYFMSHGWRRLDQA